MVKCLICTKNLSSTSARFRHIREVHGPKVICPYCFKFFGRLSGHLLTCIKYQMHNLSRLKIIKSQIYFIPEKSSSYKRRKYNYKIFKNIKNQNYKRLSKTKYYYFPDMKINKGSYCDVYYGFDKSNSQEYAVKIFENASSDYEKYLLEVGILKKLKNVIYFPSLFYSSNKNLIIVESLLGPNLRKLFKFCDNQFPIATICYIGIEAITRLEQFHTLGMVHRDVKPSNFVWGNFSANNNDFKDNIFLIDYDLSGFYKKENGEHVEHSIEVDLIGNSFYKSKNSCDFIAQSRRDDIESLIYCLIYFYTGDLPWNKKNINEIYYRVNRNTLKRIKRKKDTKERLISKTEINLEMRRRIPIKLLCNELPTEFEMILCYVRNLEFTELPNYDLIKDLFRRIINNNSIQSAEGECKYIWEKKLSDILAKNKDNQVEELERAKKELFAGYNINMKKFIKGLKKKEIICMNKILNS